MSLDSSLAIANGGLFAINNALGVVGQNVANAGTPDWTREVATQESVSAAGVGMGVRTLPTQRQLASQLQASVFTQNSTVSGLQTQQASLSGIDQIQGVVGGGTDLASLLGKLQDAFSTLAGDPSNQTQQQAVVAAAGSLTRQINALSGAIGQARQNAQDAAVSEVASLNATLGQIGGLNAQIVALQVQGQSTADLQNQRDAAVDQLNQLLPVQQIPQADGSVVLITGGGLCPADRTRAAAAQPGTGDDGAERHLPRRSGRAGRHAGRGRCHERTRDDGTARRQSGPARHDIAADAGGARRVRPHAGHTLRPAGLDAVHQCCGRGAVRHRTLRAIRLYRVRLRNHRQPGDSQRSPAWCATAPMR